MDIISSMSISSDTATLHQAVKLGNTNEIFRILQQKKLDWNAVSEGENTVLHLALKNETFKENHVVQLFKAFLDHGVDPNIQNCSRETALRLAVAKRWKDVVNLLIENKADINKRSDGGNLTAHYFVADEYRKLFNLLPFNPTAQKKLGNTHEKLEVESATFVEWMISKGFDFYCENAKGINALDLSMKYNLQHISLVLLQHTNGVNSIYKNCQTLLHLFIEKNYRCRIEYDTGNFESRNNYIWYRAYDSRYAAKIVKILLDKGVDTLAVDISGHTPLQAAIEYHEDQSIIEMLVDHRLESCKKESATAKFAELLAVCAWWTESKTQYFLVVLRTLISKGANVNAEHDNGMTPLYYAVQAKNNQAVDFLNDNHADFGAVNRNGENLFHALAKLDIPTTQSTDSTFEAMFELIASKRCCDANLKNKDKETPLHLASRGGNVVITRKLIESGVEVDSRNTTGKTPLHFVTKGLMQDEESKMVAKLLLKNGADVNAKDNGGRRPLHYVSLTRGSVVTSLFLKWGAYVNVYTDNLLNFSQDDDNYHRWMVNRSPFYLVIEDRCLEYTNEMLAYGADINDERIINMISKLISGLRLLTPSVRAVLMHWIKLKAAGLNRCEEYEAFVNDNDYQKVYQKCFKEIEKLKSNFIDTHTSIYNFLHMDFGSRRLYINNEKLKDLINSTNLERQFPQYFVLILATYRQTVAWKSLLESAKKAWRQLINVELLDECIEMIFAYFKIEDLVILVEHNYDFCN